MIRNKQSTRAFTAFLVTWAFLVLTVTGVVLYIVPQGRVANWTQWALLGLSKDSWGDLHILFGALFILAGALHLWFNWKPFRNYLAERIKGHLELKWELLTSLATTLLLAALSVANLPPASWLFDLNDDIKAAWAGLPGGEPPFGHAEDVALATLAKRAEFDLASALAAWRAAGIRVADERSTLLRLAETNATTPAVLYAHIPRSAPSTTEAPVTKAMALDPLAVEERLSGSGIGGKSLETFAREQGLPLEIAAQRLRAVNIPATAQETLKSLAARVPTRPIEIAKAVLISDYRPEPTR